ncbi:DinB family protein [Aquimarina pacifica]|uniref:DinB family protein n=1 Tax=Aquimarina pacifica TaxID=1296415 RepID=UPI0004710095|nr:DinB family protein [Aquimarina pacifica]
MNQVEFIANRLQEVLLDGHWIANTNYKEQIESITYVQATQKVGELNTIAALTFHINYYLDGLINVFVNGTLEIRDKYSYDVPPIHSERIWRDLVNQFMANAKEFVSQVKKMEESMLYAPFVDEKYGTYQRNLEGVIEHCYYHLGQISLIKKMIHKDKK